MFSSIYYTEIQSKTPIKPLSKLEQDNILHDFNYFSLPFEAPAWNSKVFNSSPVRDILATYEYNTSHISLDIRLESVTIIDFIDRKINIFYSSNTKNLIAKARILQGNFSPFLFYIDALLIHCSCVNFNNHAAVFVAMDEGGKTTAASLCENGNVLSDDQILFKRNDNEEWLAYGTPWTTFEPNPGSATPKAFFLLEKSDKFSLTKLTSKELLAHLWNEHLNTRILIPKMYHTKILDLYISLASSAPVYLMKFPKDYIDQEAILKCLDH